MMVAFAFGQRAVELDQTTNEDIIEDLLGVLNDIFEAKILELYGQALQASDVINFARSTWSEDTLFYGSYSLPLPGTTDEDNEALGRSIGNIYPVRLKNTGQLIPSKE